MLELYTMEICPYCKKVKAYFAQNGIEYKECNVDNEQYANELMKLGGKPQVPFLADKDNNVYMYESDKIIEYVQKRA